MAKRRKGIAPLGRALLSKARQRRSSAKQRDGAAKQWSAEQSAANGARWKQRALSRRFRQLFERAKIFLHELRERGNIFAADLISATVRDKRFVLLQKIAQRISGSILPCFFAHPFSKCRSMWRTMLRSEITSRRRTTSRETPECMLR
jgi:hypothetical protein